MYPTGKLHDSVYFLIYAMQYNVTLTRNWNITHVCFTRANNFQQGLTTTLSMTLQLMVQLLFLPAFSQLQLRPDTTERHKINCHEGNKICHYILTYPCPDTQYLIQQLPWLPSLVPLLVATPNRGHPP